MPLTKDELDLQEAIIADDRERVGQLIEHLETQKNFVLIALEAKKPTIAKLLLKKFKNKSSILFGLSVSGNNVFHVAAENGYDKIFAKLLEIARDCQSLAWIESDDNELDTPLHLSILENQLAIAHLLLTEIKKHPDNQTNFINRVNDDGNSPLHVACSLLYYRNKNYKQQLDFILELSLAGADHHLKNRSGKAALETILYEPSMALIKKMAESPIFINKQMPKPIVKALTERNSAIKKSYFKGLGAHGSLKQLASAFIVHNEIPLPENMVEDVYQLLEKDQAPFNLKADKELLAQLILKASQYRHNKRWKRQISDNHDLLLCLSISSITAGVLFAPLLVLLILFNTTTTPGEEFNKWVGSLMACFGATALILGACWLIIRYGTCLESARDARDLVNDVKENILDKLTELEIRKQHDASIHSPILPDTKSNLVRCTSELSRWQYPARKIELANDLEKYLKLSLDELNIFNMPFTLFRKPKQVQEVAVRMNEQSHPAIV